MTVLYVALGIIIDDIVFSDGTTCMGMLGGGGAQSAWGMALAALSGGQVGMLSGVGQDLPSEALAPLTGMGVDLTGVHVTDLPTPRAWQLVEFDGRRQHVWRVDQATSDQQTHPDTATILHYYPDALVVLWGIHPEDPHLSPCKPLRDRGILVSLEPFKGLPELPSLATLRGILTQCDIFSPNWPEAVSLFGTADRREMLQRARAAGASVLALRKGTLGAEIWDINAGQGVTVPAAPATMVVDPVGAGDAFCGAFSVIWHESRDLVAAAVSGSVAASFMLEQVGMPAARPPESLIDYRRQTVLAGARSFDLSAF
jgi:sugar/nucleoside kinase (ribokinase family)